MKEYIHKYSRWDGTQEVDLRWEKLADELLENFIHTGDFTSAMEWLLRMGADFDFDGTRLQGLNQMISQLHQLRNDLLNRFNMTNLAHEIRKRLDEIVDLEKQTITEYSESAQKEYATTQSSEARKRIEELFEREGRLSSLPQKTRDALGSLKNYDWLNPEARKRFEELLKQIQQIQKFASQYWFSGNKPMSLEESLKMMDRVRGITELMEALDQGNLADINLEALAQFLGPEAREAIETMMKFMEYLAREGMINQTEDGWEMSAKAIRRIGQRALKDIFHSVHKDAFGSHETFKKGIGTPLPDNPKPYQYGDPMNIDLKATLMSALIRRGATGTPIEIDPRDFQVAKMEYQSTSCTVLLLDMSLSMVREGRFGAAKKVAMALEYLVRTQYPRDQFHVVGFSTVAKELRGKELANSNGNLGGDIFTNIQDALRLSMKLFSGTSARNRQIILITDGQPTAYTLDGKLHVEWPMYGISPNANRETLKEVRRVTRNDIIINTFMLDTAPELMNFVNDMTKINRGRAFYTTPENLGQYLLVDYAQSRRKVIN